MYIQTNKAKVSTKVSTFFLESFSLLRGTPVTFLSFLKCRGLRGEIQICCYDKRFCPAAIPTKLVPTELGHIRLELKDFSVSVFCVQRSGQIYFMR